MLAENVMIHYARFCWERGRPRPQSLRSKQPTHNFCANEECGRGRPRSQFLATIMKIKSLAIVTTLLITMSTITTHADKSTIAADLIIINAKVHTMNQAQPLAEAVAVIGNRIVAVGSTK